MLAVLMMVPLLGMLLVRNEAHFAEKVRGSDKGVDYSHAASATGSPTQMVTRPGLYTTIAILVIAGLCGAYSQLQPRYRLADQLPDRETDRAGGAPPRRQAHAAPIRSTC